MFRLTRPRLDLDAPTFLYQNTMSSLPIRSTPLILALVMEGFSQHFGYSLLHYE